MKAASQAVTRIIHNNVQKHKEPFKLSSDFVEQYKNIKPEFGFNGLGEIVYKRTYSRLLEDGVTNEEWFQTVERVVNGTMNMSKTWMVKSGLGWDEMAASEMASGLYERIFYMKFLPPGRGLWAMGSPITEDKGLFASLNNCAFVSTGSIADCVSKCFEFMVDMAMLGVGVGFDTKGKGKIVVRGTYHPLSGNLVYVVEDTREGWVKSLKLLIDSYFTESYGDVQFDYSQVRPAGLPIKGFGGVSSGPEPLKIMHQQIKEVLEKNKGKPITATSIVDLMNLVGKCVVSGNVRRTAEISFGDPDEEFMDLKNYHKNPYRMDFGYISNNSVFAELGMDYTDASQRARTNGEPGFAWLENMQAFSRMDGEPDWKDVKATGGNPCLEQTLESYELCCLVETFPAKHESLEDYLKTLRYALFYAKTVTLGIAQFLAKYNIDKLKKFCTEGYSAIQKYDDEFSKMYCIPRSIKTTCIKPSGTVSLLAGAIPGMHYPKSKYYIRRMRIATNSDLTYRLKKQGYHVEPLILERQVEKEGTPLFDEEGNAVTEEYPSTETSVVSFPVCSGDNTRTEGSVSMWEQLNLAAFLQKYWADNQVSCTVSFDPEKEGPQIPFALNYFQYMLKVLASCQE